jgi:hypothetical protein
LEDNVGYRIETISCKKEKEKSNCGWEWAKASSTTTKHQIVVASVVLKPAPIGLFPPPRVEITKKALLSNYRCRF